MNADQPAGQPLPRPIAIVHHAGQQRFEAEVDGLRCELAYRLNGTAADFVHTGVPRRLQGRGIAAALVQAGLDWARSQGVTVRPVCSYVRVYMRRHPETQDLMPG